jgi:DNA-binding NtrC family response regulator
MQEESTFGMKQTRDEAEGPTVLALDWIFPVEHRSTTPLLKGRHTIGRSAECDIRIDSPTLSRRHAEIYRQGPLFAIRDLGSKNGIYLQGVATQHAPLRTGQLLRVGDRVALLVNTPKDGGANCDRVRELTSGLLGGSKFAQLLRPLRDVAESTLSIILEGETGTGKEGLARSIHAWSRRSGPFHAINCAALPSAMAEAELFGYRKGAFTGAERAHEGHFRMAHQGTLFLDEISELTPELQAKLLRVLQEREVLPIGGDRPLPTDIRVVAACQDSCRLATQRGRFRADLHARLDGYTCVVPPLRDRAEDIPSLFQALIDRHRCGDIPQVDVKLIERLCLYSWPQNVRELEQLAHRLVTLHRGQTLLERAFLPEHIRDEAIHAAPRNEEAPLRHEDRATYELKLLATALRKTEGNLTKAANSLGISRRRAYRLLAGRTVAALLEEESEGSLVPRTG